ncbi:MAG: hypothetical protein H0T51_22685, partial [Pirellulales bacterium]|nr:hypothetical protein [Pirellulales bacterium]
MLTRAAFNGVLEINNGHDTGRLEGVQMSLDFRDEHGQSVNDRFFVQGPTLSGVTAVDGTGVLAPLSSGTVQYTFIPTRAAAALVPTIYTIGGTLRYIDPSSGQEVVVPLLGATITVYPDPNLHLDYFQQRDVYADDPFTEETEPSEPFVLGLLVSNTGHGAAKNFSITSAQPKIIENEKGLLIDFKIIGTQVNTAEITPSLTANLGDIAPGQTAVAEWLMTSTLQGKFIEYAASFTHADELGGLATSVIDTVEIHELIHAVRVDSPTDDGRTDFLVNDRPDADNLPDMLYMSDGSVAVVNIADSVAADHPAALGQLQVHVSANMTSGWNYFRAPDPGAGYRLARVERSDGKELRVGDNVWQTNRSFPSSMAGAVREQLIHLLDRDGTGSYTFTYVVDDDVPPGVLDILNVDPDPHAGPVTFIDVVFSEPIDLATFDYRDVTLTRNGGANLITNAATVSYLSDSTYRISELDAWTAADGVYELTVEGSGIQDYGGNPATGRASDRWAHGDAAPFIDSLSSISIQLAIPFDALEVTFSEPLDIATFGYQDVKLTFNGGANLADSRLSVAHVSGSTYRVSGLASVASGEGAYRFSIDSTGVQDFSGAAGLGVDGLTWVLDATVPTVANVEQLATNPRNIVVQSLDVTFTEPIDLDSLTRDDLTLSRNGGSNLIDSRVTIEHVAGAVYRIKGINWVVGQEGTYQLTVFSAGVQDLAGNLGAGSASTSWVMDTTAPLAPTNLRITPDTGTSSSDGLTTSKTMTLSGSLGELGLSVRLVDVTTGDDLGDATVVGSDFSRTFTLNAPGNHRIQIRVVDAAGNVDLAARLLEEGGYFDVFVDLAAPTIVQLDDVAPDTRTIPVSSTDVTLSESIDLTTFDWHDLLLTRNDGPNLMNAAVTVTPVSDATYRLSGLTGLTALDGSYKLTVNASQIDDPAGNAGVGSAQVSWLMNGGGTLQLSSLGGRVFEDYNGNGASDEGDEGLSSWSVFLDLNGNGLYDAGTDPTQTTNADGRFTFDDLAAGAYQVGALPNAGWTRSAPSIASGLYIASVATGQSLNNLDFGYYLPGEIRGTMFSDLNDNRLRDDGEPGIPNWEVYLDLNGNGLFDAAEPRAMTAASGEYAFTGLAPGMYSVAQSFQPGWVQTSPGLGSSSTEANSAGNTPSTGALSSQSLVI